MGSLHPAREAPELMAGLGFAGDGAWRRVEIWPEGALTIAHDLVDAPHRGFHASIKIGLSADFVVRCGRAPPERMWVSLVAPNVQHNTDGSGSLVAALLVDPESEDYARIAHWFSAPGGVSGLPDRLAESLRQRLLAQLAAGEPLTALWDSVFEVLADGRGEPRHRDSRVAKTADYLKQNFVAPPSVAELAARVNLSVSRLVHLFTEGMGVSLRTYVHWLRMRDVLYAIAGGESLTLAAHRAGFSDLSHLTRKFRDMFGEPPSRLISHAADGSLKFVHRVAERSKHGALDEPRIVEVLKNNQARANNR